MPELPEVQTTVNGLRRTVIGLTITDAWTNYNSPYYRGSETVKDPAYFRRFRKLITGKKVISAERRAKNILINLTGGKTILVHLKMTGHLLYGDYKFDKKASPSDPWEPISPATLRDPFNRRVRFVISLSNGKYLALSDTRKFAKVTLIPTATAHESVHLNTIGPEPLDDSFTFATFSERLMKRAGGKVKLVLMDQTVIAGVGNIYADESLWRAGIHPAKLVRDIPAAKLRDLYKSVRQVLQSGIALGGSSTSDYRDIDGGLGESQGEHRAYQRTGEKCGRRGCRGTITRIVLGGRATHYCDKHQVISKRSSRN